MLVDCYETNCSSCGARVNIAFNKNVEITLSRDCSKFWDPEEVLQATWYHFSNRSNTTARGWHRAITAGDIDVHLGTKKSSTTLQSWRIQDIRKLGRTAIINPIWKIRLNSGTRIFPEVAVDKNDWYAGIPEGYDVLRYVNAWEAAGQISLLARPSVFTVDN